MNSTPGSTRWRIALKRGLGGRHRHGQQHDVGAGHGQQRRLGGDVDHAHASRAFGGRRRLAVADDALDQPGALQRQREGAAHQAAADDAELVEHQFAVELSVHVDRVGAQHLEEGADARAVRAARRPTCGSSGWPCEVDVEVVLPLARARRARLEAASSTRRASSAAPACRARRPGGWSPTPPGWCSRARWPWARGGAAGWVTMAKRVRLWASSWIAGATTCRPYSLPARSLAMAASDGSRRPGARLRRCSATGRRSACGRCRLQPGVALRQRLRMRQHGLDAVERVARGAAGCGARTGWSRR